jgi:hypothetical protein
VQNSVSVARMGSATTGQKFHPPGRLLMIAVSAGAFACILALQAHEVVATE